MIYFKEISLRLYRVGQNSKPANFLVYLWQKLWKLAGSIQSYCKNKQAYIFWHTLYIYCICVVGTLPTKPDPPTVTSIGESQVELSYGSEEPNGNRALGYYARSSDLSYVISYRKLLWCEQERWIKITQTKCDWHTFTELIPGTPYEFSVGIKIDGQLPIIHCGTINVQTEAAIVGKWCVKSSYASVSVAYRA